MIILSTIMYNSICIDICLGYRRQGACELENKENQKKRASCHPLLRKYFHSHLLCDGGKVKGTECPGTAASSGIG